MANAISAIPAGQLNGIFGHKNNNQQGDSGNDYNCQVSDKTDLATVDSLTTCWDQYKFSNSSAGLRCGGKGWYRGKDKSYQNPICQQLCLNCIDDAAAQGAGKVSCTFEASKGEKCWTGYH